MEARLELITEPNTSCFIVFATNSISHIIIIERSFKFKTNVSLIVTYILITPHANVKSMASSAGDHQPT